VCVCVCIEYMSAELYVYNNMIYLLQCGTKGLCS